MATEKIGIEVEVKGAEKSISSFKDLKTAIKAAKDEQIAMSEKFGASSVEATNAAKKIAELKDKVEDLNDSSKSLKGTGFEMLKQGFGQVREGLMNLDFDKVKTGITAMGSGFVSMGKAAMTALQGIKGAIAATGIGLLVIALGTIYAYWDDIKGVVDGLTPELKKQNEIANENLKTQQDKLNAISGQENILKLQGKTEREILQIKIKQTNEAIAASDIAIAQAEQTKIAQVEASQRNKNILQGIINFISDPITSLLRGIDIAGKAFGKDFGLAASFEKSSSISTFFFDPEEVASEGDKAIAEAKAINAKLKNDRAGLQLSINAIDTKAVENNKKANEDKVKNAKDAADKELQNQVELQAKLLELRTQLIKDEELKEQTILKNKFLADQQDLYNKGANAELLKALNDNFEQDKSVISDKYLKIKQDKEAEAKAKEQADADKAIAIIEEAERKKEQLEDAARERKLAKEKKLQQDILESVNIAAQTALSVQKTLSDTYYLKETQKVNKLYRDKLKNVVQGSKEEKAILEQKAADEKDLARKQFETQKKFNRASAILNGILGIGAIFAVPDPSFGILSAIRVGALAISTAANIAAINATQFDEGGASAGGIPAAETSAPTTSQAPSIYGPGQGGQSTTFTGNQNNNFAPVKAYVVETENRSTTNRVNKLVSESTYG